MIVSEIKLSMIAGRFDAEYYQPEYLELEQFLNSEKVVYLSSVCHVSRSRINPQKNPDAKFRYIEIENVNQESGYVTFQTILGHRAPSRARKLVKTNNVILSMVRPDRGIIGIIDPDLEGCVCSTGFCVLVPEKLDPYSLFLILKTQLVRKQLVRMTTSSMYPTVSEKDVLSVRIPLKFFESTLIESASKLVKESKDINQQARKKLKQALQKLEQIGKDIE